VDAVIVKDFPHNGPARSVVLIDEIDKAPRDFPNDLLNEIEYMYFKIPELDNTVVGGPEKLPADLKPSSSSPAIRAQPSRPVPSALYLL